MLGACDQRRARLVWCAVALVTSFVFALRTSAPSLTSPYVVADDIYQHAFWLPRLRDPELFRDDPIADYFAAQAPPGWVAIFAFATLIFDPISVSKVLPLLLTVVLSGFTFLLGLRLFGRPAAAGLGAVLLTWSVWQYDDLASAAPRSFATPLLVAFLAFLAGRQRLAGLVTLALQALIYPVGCAVMLGTQALTLLGGARYRSWSENRRELAWLVGSVAIAASLVLLGRAPAARYDPMVTAEQARGMPEFQGGGRTRYFVSDPAYFWLESDRSGLGLRRKDPLLNNLPTEALPFGLAAALVVWAAVGRLGLVSRPPIPRQGVLLLYLVVASGILFFAAHALLFRLYLPARQVQFSIPVALALGGGLSVALAAEALARRLAPRHAGRAAQLLALGALGLLVAHAPPPGPFYVVGRYPRLYAYLQAQPKDTLVAALPQDGGRLSLFTQRPMLVSREHALPYHLSYYRPLEQRSRALLEAYYADSPAPLLRLAEQEGVDVIVANLDALKDRREAGPAATLGLEELVKRCTAVRDRELVAVEVDCARRQVEGRAFRAVALGG